MCFYQVPEHSSDSGKRRTAVDGIHRPRKSSIGRNAAADSSCRSKVRKHSGFSGKRFRSCGWKQFLKYSNFPERRSKLDTYRIRTGERHIKFALIIYCIINVKITIHISVSLFSYFVSHFKNYFKKSNIKN